LVPVASDVLRSPVQSPGILSQCHPRSLGARLTHSHPSITPRRSPTSAPDPPHTLRPAYTRHTTMETTPLQPGVTAAAGATGALYVAPIRLLICGQAFVPTFLLYKGPFQHIISISNHNGTYTPSQSGASSPITMESSLIAPPSPGSLSRLSSFGQMGTVGGGDVSPCFPKEPSKLRVTLDNHCAHVMSMEFGDDDLNSPNTPSSPQQEHIAAILDFARVVKAHCVAMTTSCATATSADAAAATSSLASPPSASPSPTSAASTATPSPHGPPVLSPLGTGAAGTGAGLIVMMPPAPLMTSSTSSNGSTSSSSSCIPSPRQSQQPHHNRQGSMPAAPPGMSSTGGSTTPGGPPKHHHRSSRMSRASSSASLGTSPFGTKPSVLVHCNGGTSRSPAVAIILLTALGDTPLQALKHVMTVQSSAVPNRKLLALAGITFTQEEWSAARPPRPLTVSAVPTTPSAAALNNNVVPTPVVYTTVSQQVLSPGYGSPFQSPPPSTSSSCSAVSSVGGSVFGTPGPFGAAEALGRFPVGSPIPFHLLQDHVASLGSPLTTSLASLTLVDPSNDAAAVGSKMDGIIMPMVDVPLNTPCAATTVASGAGVGLHINIPSHGRIQR
jgi:predicted protein tyrosine phosphatase